MILYSKHNFNIFWEIKKLMLFTLLSYSLFCNGLEFSPQYSWGMLVQGYHTVFVAMYVKLTWAILHINTYQWSWSFNYYFHFKIWVISFNYLMHNSWHEKRKNTELLLFSSSGSRNLINIITTFKIILCYKETKNRKSSDLHRDTKLVKENVKFKQKSI